MLQISEERWGEIHARLYLAERKAKLADAAAKALTECRHALREAGDYFDQRADAWTEDGEWVANEELRVSGQVEDALASTAAVAAAFRVEETLAANRAESQNLRDAS